MKFTTDIDRKIRLDFNTEELEIVENRLQKAVAIGLNVGEEQFNKECDFSSQ